MPDPQPSAEYCLLWIQWWVTCLTKAEWASWVQAIGTIAALAGALYAVWWDVHQRWREARLSTAQALLSRIAVLRLVAGQWEAYLASQTTAEGGAATIDRDAHIAAMRSALAEGEQVDLRDMPTERCVEHLVQIRAAIKGAKDLLEKAGTQPLMVAEMLRLQAGQRVLVKHLDGLWDEAQQMKG